MKQIFHTFADTLRRVFGAAARVRCRSLARRPSSASLIPMACNVSLSKQLSKKNDCVAGTSFDCFQGLQPCTMFVSNGCRGKFKLYCAPDLAKRVGITCGFPGQKKTERVNCTPGDGLMQVRETAVVGTAQRPGSIPRPQPSATTGNGPRSLALCLHGKLGTWLRSASELHLDRQTSSRTPTMVQLNKIEC